MSAVENAPQGVIFVFIGLIVILVLAFTFGGTKKTKTCDELYEEKVFSGSYSATVKGTHEYRKDANGKVYVRNDTTTVIE